MEQASMCVVSKQKGTQLTVLYCRLGCLLLFWREVRGRQETMVTSYQYCEQRTRARARLLEYFFVSPSTVRDGTVNQDSNQTSLTI